MQGLGVVWGLHRLVWGAYRVNIGLRLLGALHFFYVLQVLRSMGGLLESALEP